jgi:hypothetical protein
MSSADESPESRDPGRPSPGISDSGRKRGRWLIPGVIVAVVLFLVAFMLLVSQCGGDSGEVYGLGTDIALALPALSAV